MLARCKQILTQLFGSHQAAVNISKWNTKQQELNTAPIVLHIISGSLSHPCKANGALTILFLAILDFLSPSAPSSLRHRLLFPLPFLQRRLPKLWKRFSQQYPSFHPTLWHSPTSPPTYACFANDNSRIWQVSKSIPLCQLCTRSARISLPYLARFFYPFADPRLPLCNNRYRLNLDESRFSVYRSRGRSPPYRYSKHCCQATYQHFERSFSGCSIDNISTVHRSFRCEKRGI